MGKIDEILSKKEEKRKQKRLQQQIDAWSQIPSTSQPSNVLPQNAANNLLKTNPNQKQNAFNSYTPQNMMKIVRLSQPNLVRNKIFTEFPMGAPGDSIKYWKPVDGYHLPELVGDGRYKVKDCKNGEFNKVWVW